MSYPALVLALAWSTAVALAVVLVPAQPFIGIFAAAVSPLLVVLAVFLRPALIALALAAALLGVARVEGPPVDSQAAARAVALAGETVVISGRVVDDPRPAGGGGEVLVEPVEMRASGSRVGAVGNLLVRWRGPTEPWVGDEVVASGTLRLPRDLPQFDRRAYLEQQRVYVELHAASFDVTSHGGGVAGIPAMLRARYTAALGATVPPPHAAVLLGIVLGIHRGIPPALQNALVATGLIDLLVLSGLKVAVFSRLVQAALRPLLGAAATWPALALIAVYAMAGGATPAAVRASAMGGLVIVAVHLGRPSHVWTSLALTAAAMLGWRPELAWDVGFQLSFAGTAAIILLTPAIALRVWFMPHVIREPFAVTCAAQVGTLPMMATDFHVISPVAPIANALTLPILPAVVAAGLALGALSLVPNAAQIAAIPVTGVVAYIENVGYVLSRVPVAAINVPSFPTWLGVAYYSALGPAIAGAHAAGGRRRAALVTAVLAPSLISATALVAWANAAPQAAVMNVGDGQAVLLRGPHGAVLIDAGPSPSRLNDELGQQLPPWQSTLDAIVITAPGLGHTGGFAGFARAAATVLVPDASLTGSAWRTAALEEAARGASIERLDAGMTVDVAGFRLEVLAPERGAPGDEVGAADLALRAVAPDGRSFCDFSDLDLDAQTVAASRLRGRCSDVLLPSGGRSTLSPELERAAVGVATQLIASRGTGRLAAGFPPTVLRTDQEGTITMPL